MLRANQSKHSSVPANGFSRCGGSNILRFMRYVDNRAEARFKCGPVAALLLVTATAFISAPRADGAPQAREILRTAAVFSKWYPFIRGSVFSQDGKRLAVSGCTNSAQGVCGIRIVDLNSGEIVHSSKFSPPVNRLSKDNVLMYFGKGKYEEGDRAGIKFLSMETPGRDETFLAISNGWDKLDDVNGVSLSPDGRTIEVLLRRYHHINESKYRYTWYMKTFDLASKKKIREFPLKLPDFKYNHHRVEYYGNSGDLTTSIILFPDPDPESSKKVMRGFDNETGVTLFERKFPYFDSGNGNVAMSNSGKIAVAYRSSDFKFWIVELFNAFDGTQLDKLVSAEINPAEMYFSPNGKYLLFKSNHLARPNGVLAYNVSKGSLHDEITDLPEIAGFRLDFSRDGKFMVTINTREPGSSSDENFYFAHIYEMRWD